MQEDNLEHGECWPPPDKPPYIKIHTLRRKALSEMNTCAICGKNLDETNEPITLVLIQHTRGKRQVLFGSKLCSEDCFKNLFSAGSELISIARHFMKDSKPSPFKSKRRLRLRCFYCHKAIKPSANFFILHTDGKEVSYCKEFWEEFCSDNCLKSALDLKERLFEITEYIYSNDLAMPISEKLECEAKGVDPLALPLIDTPCAHCGRIMTEDNGSIWVDLEKHAGRRRKPLVFAGICSEKCLRDLISHGRGFLADLKHNEKAEPRLVKPSKRRDWKNCAYCGTRFDLNRDSCLSFFLTSLFLHSNDLDLYIVNYFCSRRCFHKALDLKEKYLELAMFCTGENCIKKKIEKGKRDHDKNP
jgi:ribosomal protein L34E